MAASVAAGNSAARVFARKTRASCGANLFIHSDPSGNRKTRRRARGKNSADTTAGFARGLRSCACAPQLGKSLTQIEASGIDIMLVLDVSGSMLTKDFAIGGQEA